MKGRRLTDEEVKKTEVGKVYVESTNSLVPNGVYHCEHRHFYNDEGNSFFNGCTSLELGYIKVYEYIEEPRTYKTSEMIAELEKNPKLKFRNKNTLGVCWTDEHREVRFDMNLNIHGKWTLIEEPKEVTFAEAIKAAYAGKKVYSDRDGLINKYNHKNGFVDQNGQGVSAGEFTDAKWYIGEPS